MLDDTTSPVQDTEITDQSTLDAAIAAETAKLEGEPEETPTQEEPKDDSPEAPKLEPKPEEDYRQRYSAMRKDYDKLVGELKQLKSQESKAKLQDMDYDQRLEYVIDRLNTYEDQFGQLQNGLSEQFITQAKAEDAAHLDSFLTSDSELSEFPELHSIFKMYANSDQLVDPAKYGDTKWNQVKLEDIKNVVIKPMIDKLSGKKITVREKPIRGRSTPTVDSGWTSEKIASLSPQEYEKNRTEILRASGVKDL